VNKLFIGKTKIAFSLGTIALIFSLFLIFFISKNNSFIFQREKLTQEMEYYVSEIDNYLQVGQIYLDGFTKNIVLSVDNESLFLQLKKFLTPFPFFSQLSLMDSSGRLVTGFPQNNVGQLTSIEKQIPIIQSLSEGKISVFTGAYPNSPSLLIFLMKIGNESNGNSLYLLGESDLRANPLNTGLMIITNQLIKGNIAIQILDSTKTEIISFQDTYFSAEKKISALTVTRNIALTNWQINFYYPEEMLTLDALYSSIPLAISAIIFYILCIFIFVINKSQLPQIKGTKNYDLSESDELKNRLTNFKETLLRSVNLDEIAQLILNYSELASVSAVRIILAEYPFSEKENQLIFFGQGIKSNHYAYLDRQIFDRVKQNQTVNFADIRKIQQIRLQPDKEYPLAIFAYAIKIEKTLYGVLWLGYEKPYQVTEKESSYIQELIEVGKNQIILLIKNEVYKNISINQNATLETLQSPVILLNKDNVLLYSNHAAEKLIGNHNESLGEKIPDLVTEPSLMNVFQKESFQNDYEFTSLDGSTYLVHSSIVQTLENQTIKIFIFHDISSEKRISSEFNEYSALLSHDLRAPLTIIKGYTTMLPIMGTLNDQQREYVEKIISGVDEMTNLVKDLLNYDRLEMGVNPLKKETEIIKLLDKVVDALCPLAEQKRIDVIREYKDSCKEIAYADPTLIEQAIYNLIDNAIRFTPIQGKVTVNLNHVGNMIEINVEDTGCGIAAVDIPHIFERFYRVKISSKYNQYGSGIGLALVKLIIEKHNGEVGAISNLGKGSTFYLRIPER